MIRFFAASAVLMIAALSSGCQSPPVNAAKAPDPEIAWQPLGSWSGRGNSQTESFTSGSGSIRVQWKTEQSAAVGTSGKNTGGKKEPDSKAAPAFRLTIHSAISGRPLMEAVDEQGPGTGTAFVHEDPRVFFAVVESAGLDWSFTLQEAVLVERKRP
jgi:hypothetical protein